jgi:DUF2075 family protein
VVGDALAIENGRLVGVPQARSGRDSSVRGWKKLLKEDPEEIERLEDIIKNTYRTLMTGGMKGCFVYFTNKEVEKYFKSRM